ncbi:MAG: deoxyhypusine synthase [Candidatus Diapherotrites archaeon]
MKLIDDKKLEKAYKADFKRSVEIKGVAIRGHDFERKYSLKDFIENYYTIGFQASHLAIAVDIIKEMRREKATIFLAYNSNMVSSGLRETIAYLVKRKLVHVLVTTAGGVEEDIIKTMKPFLLGSFGLEGKKLRAKGINRIGNIIVPNNRYIMFERFMQKFLEKMYKKQLQTGKSIGASEFIYELGKEIKDQNSIYYWATKNNIPCFCPALTDGAIGDNIFFFKQKRPDFQLDIADDIVKLGSIAINAEKTGIIVLGGGFIKHHVCNANLLRDGAEYAVYITTETEEGGSDSGARPDEAVSWGKIKASGRMVKVYGDATLIFPLVVAGAFVD